MKILITPTSLQPCKESAALKTLEGFSGELIFNTTGRPLTEDELIPLLKECDGYIAGLDFITKKVIDACPNLKVISRYGAGYDRVDIQAAKAKNIPVTITPGVNSQAVGELAFGLILSAARKIPYLNFQTCHGNWIRSTGMELRGKTLGILGIGAVGKVVANCAQGFGMTVTAYDPYADSSYCLEHSILLKTFDELITQADVISLHLPLTPDTHHLINREVLAKMKDSALLINASRGGIIDEEAAYEALKSGKLGGLGLDAFEVEPPSHSPLFECDNVVVTPHTGAHTKEATDKMAEAAVNNLITVLSGRECPFIVKDS